MKPTRIQWQDEAWEVRLDEDGVTVVWRGVEIQGDSSKRLARAIQAAHRALQRGWSEPPAQPPIQAVRR